MVKNLELPSFGMCLNIRHGESYLNRTRNAYQLGTSSKSSWGGLTYLLVDTERHPWASAATKYDGEHAFCNFLNVNDYAHHAYGLDVEACSIGLDHSDSKEVINNAITWTYKEANSVLPPIVATGDGLDYAPSNECMLNMASELLNC